MDYYLTVIAYRDIEAAKRTLSAGPQDGPAARRLLEDLLTWFARSAEAWPAGLRFGEAWADHDTARLLKSDLGLARRLDRDGRHAAELDAFEAKVNITIGQLRSDEGRCFF